MSTAGNVMTSEFTKKADEVGRAAEQNLVVVLQREAGSAKKVHQPLTLDVERGRNDVTNRPNVGIVQRIAMMIATRDAHGDDSCVLASAAGARGTPCVALARVADRRRSAVLIGPSPPHLADVVDDDRDDDDEQHHGERRAEALPSRGSSGRRTRSPRRWCRITAGHRPDDVEDLQRGHGDRRQHDHQRRRMLGTVMKRNILKPSTPSIRAASMMSSGIALIAAESSVIAKPAWIQIITTMRKACSTVAEQELVRIQPEPDEHLVGRPIWLTPAAGTRRRTSR